MKVSQAVDFHLQYHRANSKKNTVKTSEFVLSKFATRFCDRELAGISQEEVLDFLLTLTKDNKQATKRNRYSVLSSFYNFSINTGLPSLANPCNTTVIKKIFKRPPPIQWQIVDKDTVDEIIFRTTNKRNHLMLELMARGGIEGRGGLETHTRRCSGVLTGNSEPQEWEKNRDGLCSTKNPGKVK